MKRKVKKALSYILTCIYLVVFGVLILLFHPLQVLMYNFGGKRAHKVTVDCLNFLLIRSLLLIAVDFRIHYNGELPLNRPVIIISNHQSAFDIPAIIWSLRKLHPRFVSKIELGKGIPSVSYNLRKSNAALIDRKNRKQSVEEIAKLGKLIQKDQSAACIFPEGTRSKTGKLRRFNTAGVETLLQAAPDAVIVPFVIDGNAKLQKHGFFPLSGFRRLNYTVLPFIEPGDAPATQLLATVKQQMEACLERSA